ncbi:cell division cycle 20-like protein 1 cofactor of APC complex [Clonorchis sinensis]|uniref:Cell division cycle 20-like protein 1 cofactor of APC complex n=1 Tax=Clonorchis sinensis TaxID=79923 RepID=G7YLH8_CLOSI|nr:cell division cycle 20-like protein 1 cofactor of APC complex [Clonorchis sinensis]
MRLALPVLLSLEHGRLLFADDLKSWSSNASAFQMDADAAKQWSLDWHLPLNDEKCVHMSFGGDSANSFVMHGEKGPEDITRIDAKRDLGIWLSPNLSFSLHLEKSAQKAFAVLRMIRRTFSRITRTDFQILYGAYVRPLLEYANPVVYSGRTKDVILIERVQRAATKMVAGLKSMDYETRLAVLDLFPLKYRHPRGDLILTYVLFEQGLANRFFTVDPANTRRGHGKVVLDLFPLEYRRLRGDLILTYALFEQGLANRFFTVDPANTRRGHDPAATGMRNRCQIAATLTSVAGLSRNWSMKLFSTGLPPHVDNANGHEQVTSQSNQQSHSAGAESSWRVSANRTTGTPPGRIPSRDPAIPAESHVNDLLAALVANEVADSSMGGSFSPTKPDYISNVGSSSVLAAKENGNMFSYKIRKDNAAKMKTSPYSMSPVSEKSQSLLKYPQKQTRRISRVPYKVLDAPELQDDFYLNLVDWSSQNVLAVGLGTCVYLWNAFNSQVTRLCDVSREGDVISSVAWSKKGEHLAIGTYRGHVQIWDVTKASCLRSLTGHIARVGALAWNADLLASGSRDRYILLRDTRASATSGGGLSDPVPSAHHPSSNTVAIPATEMNEQPMLIDGSDPDSPSTPYHVPSMDTDLTDLLGRPDASSSPPNNGTGATDLNTTDSDVRTTRATNDLDVSRSLGFSGPRWTGSSNLLGTHTNAGTALQTVENGADRSISGAVRVLKDHRQEVCGLKWSPDSQYLASGGNDNRLLVWSQHAPASGGPVLTYEEHVAAVKAIAWSPHQHGLLASGGGTADRCIRFWNTLTGQALRWVDTGSQVCNIAWSVHSNELVSTHGYSQNQILVWRYPSLTQLVKLTGHSYRVLYLAISPDGENIVTGAGDETLRFWNIFTKSKTPKVPVPRLLSSICSGQDSSQGSPKVIRYTPLRFMAAYVVEYQELWFTS